MFTSLTIVTLQTIIFASASTPGSGGYVPGFKVHACSLVFRLFPRDDPSSERRGNKCPYGWVGGFIPPRFTTDPSTWKSSSGKRFHSICCWLHNVCTGKPSCTHNCWLERTKVFLHFVFSFSFSLFAQVCHVLRRLLVHSIYRPAASSQVKMIWASKKKLYTELTRKKIIWTNNK